MKKNSEIAKFGWKKIRIKWNLDLCNRNICVLLEHQSKGKMSIYLAATSQTEHAQICQHGDFNKNIFSKCL